MALAGGALALGGVSSQSHAQERIPIDLGEPAQEGASSPPAVLDILVPPPANGALSPAEARECEDEIEASEVSGEIVVCRRITDRTDRFSGSYADWLKDYAERTANLGAPSAPNVDGTGLPPGMVPFVTVKGCFLPPCPKEPALLIDVEKLPSAPVGTDADRLAQGLPPRREGEAYTPEERRRLETELVLPPLPDFRRPVADEGER